MSASANSLSDRLPFEAIKIPFLQSKGVAYSISVLREATARAQTN